MSYIGFMKALHKKTCGLCCTKLINFGVTIGRTEILHDINLHIHCGELTALIGPNGAGKTTLLKAILGEIKHTGELHFLDAEDCLRTPVVGYVPQRIDFEPGSPISVLDLFSACSSSWPVCLGHSQRMREQASASLASVQAEHLLNRCLGGLSGGELQRVLLAMALDSSPDLLLLDEPVSGIDVQGKDMFYDLISHLRRKYDLSIILVSHDWGLVSHYADRIVLLDRTVQCCGTPQEVFSNEQVLQAYGPAAQEDMAPLRMKPQIIHRSGGVQA
ncbi:MAG: metal ABC transporter ATP-binding protein [Desulfotomaculaceae bacterium]|nr:metal ABC transporter ATP-binding protein [Desulfotomaculaceae bacterium]